MQPIGPFVVCSMGSVATPGRVSAAVLRRLVYRGCTMAQQASQTSAGAPDQASGCKTLGSDQFARLSHIERASDNLS